MTRYTIKLISKLAALGTSALFCIALASAQPGVYSPAQFTGTGLNDAFSVGTITGPSSNFTITIIIDGTGSPNTFKWQKNNGAFATAVNITGANQILANGVGITFTFTTGHTLGDKWVILETAHSSINTSNFIAPGVGAVFRSAETKLRDAINVTDYGAVHDGVTNDAPAILAAFAANPGGNIQLTAGQFSLDNSSGPIIISGWSGRMAGAGPGTVISCTTLAQRCLEFDSPTNLTIDNLTITFGPTAMTRGGTQFELYVVSGTNVVLSNLIFINGPTAGLTIQQCDNVQTDNVTYLNLLANGLIVTNTTHMSTNNTYCNNVQDACEEFSGYDAFGGVPAGFCQFISITNMISYNSFAGILINACQDVNVNGFSIYGTYNGGIAVYQDSGTTTTKFPTRIAISNGNINHMGYLASVNGFAYGILINEALAPPYPIDIAISNVTIFDTLFDGIDVGVEGSSSTQLDVNLSLSNVIVDTTQNTSGTIDGGGVCFSFAAKGTITFNNIQARNCSGRGLQIGAEFNFPLQVSGSDLYIYNAQSLGTGGSPDPTVFYANLNVSDNVVINNLFVQDDRNPAKGYQISDGGTAPVLLSSIHSDIPHGTYLATPGSIKSIYSRADSTTPVNTYFHSTGFGHAASKLTAGEPVNGAGQIPELEVGYQNSNVGSGASATAVVGGGGSITGVTGLVGGTGYVAGETCVQFQGTNTGIAAAHAVVTAGAVASIVIDGGGSGYSSPTIIIANCGFGWLQATLSGLINTNLLLNANGGRILLGAGGIPTPASADDGFTLVQIPGGGLKAGADITAVGGFAYGPTPTAGYTGIVGCGFVAGGGIVTASTGGTCNVSPYVFSMLPAPSSGVYSIIRCTDCAVSTPCKGGGSGAFAFSDGTRYSCPFR